VTDERQEDAGKLSVGRLPRWAWLECCVGEVSSRKRKVPFWNGLLFGEISVTDVSSKEIPDTEVGRVEALDFFLIGDN
jgi:hypothetical protein